MPAQGARLKGIRVLVVHRAERADTLVVALAELMAVPPPDPFTPEVVVVPARGVERWLTQSLSTRLGRSRQGDGIAANIAFPSPAELVSAVSASATGTSAAEDPWSPGRLVWAVLNTVDAVVGQPWCASLTVHLDSTVQVHRIGRRYATASTLTTLFTAYGAERPAMVREWADGMDTDGAGVELPEDIRWQPQLWRRVRDAVGGPSPAETLPAVTRFVGDRPQELDLPGRVSVFGPTRLTTQQLAVLAALSEHRDVHLWLHHPSPAMWDDLGALEAASRRADDVGVSIAGNNPLLASLGRDVRELQQRLPAARVDVHHPADPDPLTVLSRLQDDIRRNRTDSAARLSADGSVAAHICHGPARQVEALRETLLTVFTDMPDLEARDVVVMCPDVELFAPLIQAAFGQPATGAAGGHPGHGLRVRLADRGLTGTNPLLELCSRLLGMAGGRVTATELLDVAALNPVARRFGFTVDELAQLRRWAGEANLHWGLSQADRDAYAVPAPGGIATGTAQAAMSRLLLGVAADAQPLDLLGGVLPLADVDSSDIDLAGRFAEFTAGLESSLSGLTGTHAAATWTDHLINSMDSLAAVGRRDAWKHEQAVAELTAATEHAPAAQLRLADVRVLLAGRLAPRPTRANFRTGELTVSSLVPMRSVPHRVVVLLGLDDDSFPRATHPDGDDVLARDPRIGERDPRHEDRQLLLDALMSATDRLLVFYSGADRSTGAPRPPASPVADVLDAVAAVTELEAVSTRHPLQTFDAANFAGTPPISFDADAFAGAVAAARPPAPAAPFLPGPLAPPAGDAGVLELDELTSLIVHPQRAFLRERLGVVLAEESDDVDDALPVEMNGLSRWQVGERMLRERLEGAGASQVGFAELARGSLPLGPLGMAAGREIRLVVDRIVAATQALHSAQADAVDVDVELGGRRLAGTVAGVRGQNLVATTFSTLRARHRLGAWVRLLALAAARPDVRWQAVTTGWGGTRARPGPWRSTLTAPDDPGAVLRQLAALWDDGMLAPLPMSASAACAYAERRNARSSAEMARVAAQQSWDGEFDGAASAPNAYLYGSGASFDVLWDEPSPAGGSRFAVLAFEVWAPLLACETWGPV